MIVDCEEGDSTAVRDADIVSNHGVGYMQYTDGMLHDLIDMFDHDEYDYIIVNKLRSELARRESLGQERYEGDK